MKTTIASAPEPEAQKADLLGRAMLLILIIGLVIAGVVVARTKPALPQPAIERADGETPATPPPPVEPVLLKPVTAQDAVTINGAVPFSTAPNPAARPFVLSAGSGDYARALDCLAVAGIYEAGSADLEGQRAVMQVILNRMRHPAFPKTVCGVVFQGSERATGCQFTFTCDGALRRYGASPDAWKRAREVATQMLGGRVYTAVGHATHYHTDWVVPYWSASLDKVTAVGTHLFFRWTGWWGTPRAFGNGYRGGEPGIGLLAAISEAHKGAPMPTAQLTSIAASEQMVPATPNPVLLAKFGQTVLQEGNTFIVPFGRKPADQFPGLALAACGALDHCKVMGWADTTKAPTSFPVDPASLASMSFSYLRDKRTGFEKALWNCAEFDRADKRQCMKTRAVAPRDPALPRTGRERVIMKDFRPILRRDPEATTGAGTAEPATGPRVNATFSARPRASAS